MKTIRPVMMETMEARTLLSSGVLDPTFGVAGIETTTAPAGEYLNAGSIAVQPDGKVLQAVDVENGQLEITSSQIYRFLTDGSLDSSFGVGGIVTLPAGDEAHVIVVQPNGKIIIAGGILGRLNADGSLDTSFAGGKGIEDITNLGGASDAVLQPDGQIVVASSQIIRFNSNGTRDMTFGVNGAAVLPTASVQYPDSTVGGISTDSLGRIVVSVSDQEPVDQTADPGYLRTTYGVVRLLANGKADPSFGSDGLSLDTASTITALPIDFDANDPGPIAVALDGTIYQIGNRQEANGTFSDIWAYAPGGLSQGGDRGSDGSPVTILQASDLVVQPDGKLLVLNSDYTQGSASPFVTVFRFMPYSGIDGDVFDLDDSFDVMQDGASGESDISLLTGPFGYATPESIAFMSDGQIVFSAAMQGDNGLNFCSNIVRLQGDPTFTASGTVFSDPTGGGSPSAGEGFIPGVDVYADLNNNGKYDPGEPETSTGADGSYSLQGLPAGPVIIRQILPSGQRQSSPADGFGQHIVVSATPDSGVDFRDTTKILVSGTVFDDVNGDGKQDDGETGLAGWTVYADLNNDGIFEPTENSKITDASGNFSFVGLSAGTYIFRVVAPKGWHQTFPTKNFGQHVTLGSGGVIQNVVFGMQKIG